MVTSLTGGTVSLTGGGVDVVWPASTIARTSIAQGSGPSGTWTAPGHRYWAMPTVKVSAWSPISQLTSAIWMPGGHSQETVACQANGVTTSFCTGSVTPTSVARPTTMPVPP